MPKLNLPEFKLTNRKLKAANGKVFKFGNYYNSIYLVDCNKNLMKETKYA